MHTAGTQRLTHYFRHKTAGARERQHPLPGPLLPPRALLRSFRTTVTPLLGDCREREGEGRGAGGRTAPGFRTDRQAPSPTPGTTRIVQQVSAPDGPATATLRSRQLGRKGVLISASGGQEVGPGLRQVSVKRPRTAAGAPAGARSLPSPWRCRVLGPRDLAPQPRHPPVLPANRNWAQTLAIA